MKSVLFRAAAAAGMIAASTVSIAFPGFTTVYSTGFTGSVGSAPGAEWTATPGNVGALLIDKVPTTTGLYANQTFLGQFGGFDSVTLTVTNPFAGTPTIAYLAFDAYLIRSWDGNDLTVVNSQALGPDTLGVRASSAGGSQQLFEYTFSVGNAASQTQSYCYGGAAPCAPTWGAKDTYALNGGANALGYVFQVPDLNGNPVNQPLDMVYSFDRPQSPGLSFLFSGPTLTITFYSKNLQVRPDLAGSLGILADESWGLDSVRVEMAPVPEPGTYALIAAGLVAVLLITRRRTRAHA